MLVKTAPIVIAFTLLIIWGVFGLASNVRQHDVNKDRLESKPPSLRSSDLSIDKQLPFSTIVPDTTEWPIYCDIHLQAEFKYPPAWKPEWNHFVNKVLIVVAPPAGQRRDYTTPGDGRVDFGVEIAELGNNPLTFPEVTAEDLKTFSTYKIPLATTTLQLGKNKVFLVYSIWNNPLGIVGYLTLRNTIVEVSFDPFFEGENSPSDWGAFVGILATLQQSSCAMVPQSRAKAL